MQTDYVQFSKYFDSRNGDKLACSCCGKIIINEASLQHYRMLTEFREWYNRSMAVNSGVRCEEYNKKVKGEDGSKHLLGIATDIAWTDEFKNAPVERKKEIMRNVRRKWMQICARYGVQGGVGFYNTFFHLDSRPTDGPAFWNKTKIAI